MNDPTYVEAARVLATHALQCDTVDDEATLAWMFQQVLQREPTDRETEVLLAFYTRNRIVYEQAHDDADQLVKMGLAPAADDLDRQDLASWTCVARAVLNLHETITRY